MSIADAAILAEAIRSAFNGYGRNSKPIRRSRAGGQSRTSARLPLSVHHHEGYVLSTFTGMVRDTLRNDILLIDQGFKDNQRTGRTIRCRQFVFEGIVDDTDTAIHPATLVKIDLILDRQPDGETATSEDIWELPVSNQSAIGLPNLHGKPRFKFLASRSYSLDVYNQGKPVSMQVPLNFTTTYGESTGSETQAKDVLTNSLLFSIRCLGADGALASTIRFTGQMRVLFTD